MIDINEEVKKNRERVNIILGEDALEEIEYCVPKLKQKKFKPKMLKAALATLALAGVTSGSYIAGHNIGENEGMKTESVVSDLDEDNINYTMESAPDIVIIKYLNYATNKDNLVKPDCEEALRSYSNFESDSQTRPLKKEESQDYKNFRNTAQRVSQKVPFGPFKYSIAVDENGKKIVDNTSNILVDNQNCLVFMPTKEKVDTNNLPEGSFVDGDTLYVPFMDESSIYNKSK